MFIKRALFALVFGVSACAFHADLGSSTTPTSGSPTPPSPAPAPAAAAPAPAPAANPSLAAGAPTTSAGGMRYVGCFIDSTDRDLPELDKAIGGLSLEVCAAQCRELKAPYFGVQGGVQCRCGQSYGKYGKVSDSECKEPCQGNNKQMCGAPWRNSVYQLR
jgi:hypothetical protein